MKLICFTLIVTFLSLFNDTNGFIHAEQGEIDRYGNPYVVIRGRRYEARHTYSIKVGRGKDCLECTVIASLSKYQRPIYQCKEPMPYMGKFGIVFQSQC